MEKNKAIVQVHGMEYTVIGRESPEYIQAVAAYVNRRMEELSALGRTSEQRLAILTAINITDELLKAKNDIASLRQEMSELQRTIRRLEREKAAPRGGDKH